MQSIALVFHVILAVVVIGLVLIQHGKGADAGAAFGSGASATVFGARGATSFLTRATTIGAVAFFATSLFLFYLAAHREGSVRSVTEVPGLVEDAPLAPAPLEGDLPGAIAPAGQGSDDASTDLPAEPAAGEAQPAADAVEAASEEVQTGVSPELPADPTPEQ